MIIKAQQLANITAGHIYPQLNGAFADDARTAIQQAPDYFVRWYTLKSIGLGIAVGVIGFLIGRATAKR